MKILNIDDKRVKLHLWVVFIRDKRVKHRLGRPDPTQSAVRCYTHYILVVSTIVDCIVVSSVDTVSPYWHYLAVSACRWWWWPVETSSVVTTDMPDPENPIGSLQELAQSRGVGPPQYVLQDASGESHFPSFTIQVCWCDLTATGVGTSKVIIFRVKKIFIIVSGSKTFSCCLWSERSQKTCCQTSAGAGVRRSQQYKW